MDIKKAKKINRRFYGCFYRLIKMIAEWFNRRGAIYGYDRLPEDEPVIYISRHENVYAPVHILAHTEIPRLRVWAMYFFCDCKAAFHQYRTYTLPINLKWGKVPSTLGALLFAPLVSWLMRSGKAIPVYRQSKDVIITVKESVKALQEGDSLLIMPEKDYNSLSPEIHEMYTGFLQIARLYAGQTGKDLKLIPIYTHPGNGNIYFRKPLIYLKEQSFRENKERLLPQLEKSLSDRRDEE